MNSDTEKFHNDDAYYSDKEYLSNSMLKLMRESPTKFKLYMEGKWRYPDAAHFAVGSAIHALFLEGEERIGLWDGTKRGKDYNQFKLECEQKKLHLLNQREYDDIMSMTQKLQSNEAVSEIMGNFKPEVPMARELHGFKMKGKADALVHNWDKSYIVDLKTTAKSLDEFSRAARYMFYDQQAALYTDLFMVDEFYFVVIEKSWPFEIGIFKCSEQFINGGRKKLLESLSTYEHLFVNGFYNENKANIYEL